MICSNDNSRLTTIFSGWLFRCVSLQHRGLSTYRGCGEFNSAFTSHLPGGASTEILQINVHTTSCLTRVRPLSSPAPKLRKVRDQLHQTTGLCTLCLYQATVSAESFTTSYTDWSSLEMIVVVTASRTHNRLVVNPRWDQDRGKNLE